MSDASFLDPIADILNFTPEQKTMFTKDYNRDISTQIVILSGLSKEELLPIASIKDKNSNEADRPNRRTTGPVGHQ